MLNDQLKAAQRLRQIYRVFDKQIIAFSNKSLVIFLLNDDYHISGFNARLKPKQALQLLRHPKVWTIHYTS